MTVIDSLFVILGLDSKDLESKSPAAVKSLADIEKQGEKTEKSTKKLSETRKAQREAEKKVEKERKEEADRQAKAEREHEERIKNLSRAVETFLAIIGGTMAIKAFIADFIDTNAQLDRLSENLGLSVSTISAWGNAVEGLGGSAEGLQGTLDMLSKSQTQLMLTGESSLIPYLSALGISLADTTGKARPVTDILLDLSDQFSKMDRTTANNLGRMMGLDQGTLNLLLQGRKELELEINRQKQSAAVTKEQAAEAQKLQTQIVNLKQQFMSFGRTLLMDAAPGIEKLLGYLQNFGDWIGGHKQFVEDFLTTLAVGLGAIAIATLPIDGAVLGIIALAGAIALLADDYQTWKKGGDSFVDWSKWEPGIKAATIALKILGEQIDADFWLIKKLFDLWDKLPDWAKKIALGPVLSATSSGDSQVQRSGSGASSVADQARGLAQQVSAQTGVPADLIYAQWQHETGNFTNRGATQLNNLAGVNTPGGTGQDYRQFDSLQDFAKYYAYLLRPGGHYDSARSARTPAEFAHALKQGGYYSDSESNYASGIAGYLKGVPGASQMAANAPQGGTQQAGNTDRSVEVNIQQIDVKTQATDAIGISADLARALDYSLVSQANYGSH